MTNVVSAKARTSPSRIRIAVQLSRLHQYPYGRIHTAALRAAASAISKAISVFS